MTKREKWKNKARFFNSIKEMSFYVMFCITIVTTFQALIGNISKFIPIACFIIFLPIAWFHVTRKFDEFMYDDLTELILENQKNKIKIINLTGDNLFFCREDLVLILLPARYKKRIKPLISNSTLPEIIQNAPDEENNVFYIVNQNKKTLFTESGRNDILFIEKSNFYITERGQEKIPGKEIIQLKHINEQEFNFTIYDIKTEGDGEEIC